MFTWHNHSQIVNRSQMNLVFAAITYSKGRYFCQKHFVSGSRNTVL